MRIWGQYKLTCEIKEFEYFSELLNISKKIHKAGVVSTSTVGARRNLLPYNDIDASWILYSLFIVETNYSWDCLGLNNKYHHMIHASGNLDLDKIKMICNWNRSHHSTPFETGKGQFVGTNDGT